MLTSRRRSSWRRQDGCPTSEGGYVERAAGVCKLIDGQLAHLKGSIRQQLHVKLLLIPRKLRMLLLHMDDPLLIVDAENVRIPSL